MERHGSVDSVKSEVTSSRGQAQPSQARSPSSAKRKVKFERTTRSSETNGRSAIAIEEAGLIFTLTSEPRGGRNDGATREEEEFWEWTVTESGYRFTCAIEVTYKTSGGHISLRRVAVATRRQNRGRQSCSASELRDRWVFRS